MRKVSDFVRILFLVEHFIALLLLSCNPWPFDFSLISFLLLLSVQVGFSVSLHSIGIV